VYVFTSGVEWQIQSQVVPLWGERILNNLLPAAIIADSPKIKYYFQSGYPTENYSSDYPVVFGAFEPAVWFRARETLRLFVLFQGCYI
jgi:hypothetical protein